MKNSKNLLYLCLACFIQLVSACKHEPDEPELPKAYPANADFLIEEKVGERWFLGDTIGAGNITRFTALHPYDSLQWIIGSDTIRNKKSFTKTGFPPGQWISIQLIVWRKADPLFFPYDDGADTLLRQFFSWFRELDDYVYKDMPLKGGGTNKFWVPQLIHYAPIWGTYKGYKASRPAELTYVTLLDTFKYLPAEPGFRNFEDYDRVAVVRNLTYPGYNMDDFIFYMPDYYNAVSPKAVYINQTAYGGFAGRRQTWPALKAYAWLDGPEHIQIDYAYQDTLTGIWIKDFFSGKKAW